MPKNLEKLKDAVETWYTKGAENFDTRKKNTISKRSYEIEIGIPYGKLQNYINDDISKRYKLGVSFGRKSHLDMGDYRFVASVLISSDRGNNGMDQKYAIDMITYVVPTLSVKNIKMYYIEPSKRSILVLTLRNIWFKLIKRQPSVVQ